MNILNLEMDRNLKIIGKILFSFINKNVLIVDIDLLRP